MGVSQDLRISPGRFAQSEKTKSGPFQNGDRAKGEITPLEQLEPSLELIKNGWPRETARKRNRHSYVYVGSKF